MQQIVNVMHWTLWANKNMAIIFRQMFYKANVNLFDVVEACKAR